MSYPITISLGACNCACPGACDDGAVLEITGPFAEYYSDLGAKKSLPDEDAGSGLTAASGAGDGYYENGDFLEYELWAVFSGYYKQTGATTLSVMGITQDVNLDWTGPTEPPLYYAAFRRLNGGAWLNLGSPDFTNTEIGHRLTDYGIGVGGTDWQSLPVGVTTPAEYCTPVALDYADANQSESVSKLEDQSGNERHLFQNTEANCPILSASDALNGHAPLEFASNSNWLRTAAFASQSLLTIFVVLQTELGAQPAFVSLAAASYVGTTPSGPYFMRGSAVLTSAVLPAAGTAVLAAVFDGANSKLYLDGVEIASGTAGVLASTFLEVSGVPVGLKKFYALVAYASAFTAAAIASETSRLEVKYAL